MQGQRIGYIRVSSFEQNPERQLDQVQVSKVFTDKASGKDSQSLQISESQVVGMMSLPEACKQVLDPRVKGIGLATDAGLDIHAVQCYFHHCSTE